MPRSAPRLPWPLVETIRALADSERPIADVWRDACAFADRNDFTLPSYEHVRRLVHRERAFRRLPRGADALVDGWLRVRSPENAIDEAFRRAAQRRALREQIEAERSWRPTGRGGHGM